MLIVSMCFQTMCRVLSALSPGDDLRLELAIRLRSDSVRSDFSWK